MRPCFGRGGPDAQKRRARFRFAQMDDQRWQPVGFGRTVDPDGRVGLGTKPYGTKSVSWRYAEHAFRAKPHAGSFSFKVVDREHERGPFGEEGEVWGIALAKAILETYASLTATEKVNFFQLLNENLGLDADTVSQPAKKSTARLVRLMTTRR